MRLTLVSLLLGSLALSACDRKEPAQDQAPAPTNPGLAAGQELQLPAAFRGTIPCADCRGIDMRLLLRSDHSYLLDERYMSADLAPSRRFSTLGRWESHDGQIRLSDSRTGTRYFRIVDGQQLKMQNSSGAEIGGQMSYALRRSDMPFLPTGHMTLRGHYSRGSAGPGLFTECSTGLRWPVAASGDHLTLESRYETLRAEPGAPVYVELDAYLARQPRAKGEGSEEVVFADRVSGIEAQRACPLPP